MKSPKRFFNRDIGKDNNSLKFHDASADSGHTVGMIGKIAIGFLLVAAFVSLGLQQVVLHDDPNAYDTPGYLMEANRISEYGGLLSFPKMIIAGDYQQANQHPLYILMITPFAELDFNFVVTAKLVSLFFGCLTVVLGYVLLQQLYSHSVAMLASAGFLLTRLFIKWSTLVGCESLLILFSTIGIIAILAGFRNRKYWIYGGLFVGLAYLTKVTALLLLPGFIIATSLTLRSQLFRTKEAYLFFVAFLIGCSPLLVNNIIVNGNPIYNTNIANLTDSGATIEYFETSMARGSSIPVYKDFDTEIAEKGKITMGIRGAVDLIVGIGRRLPREFTMFLETFSIWPMETRVKPVRWAFGAAVLAFFLVGLRREKQIGAQIYILVTVLTFLTALSLHRPIARYLLPIIFFVWVYAAIGVLYVGEKIARQAGTTSESLERVARYSIATLFVSVTLWVFTTQPIARVSESVTVSEHRIELVNWMRRNLEPTDRYMEGPNFGWVIRNGISISSPVHIRASRQLYAEFAERHNVRYIIAEIESLTKYRYRGHGLVDRRLKDRRLKFEGILEIDEKNGLVEKEIPQNWRRVKADENNIVKYVIYELTRSSLDGSVMLRDRERLEGRVKQPQYELGI